MSDLHHVRSAEPTETSPRNGRGEQAVFLGWQRTRSGKVYALYNITAKGHPYFGSTVSDRTLRRLNLDIPSTPPLVRKP